MAGHQGKNKRHAALAAASFCVLALTGCASEMHAPGNLTESRVQLEEKHFVHEVDTGFITNEMLVGLADHYRRHGEGPVSMMVSYDPGSRANNAVTASRQSSEIVTAMRKQGITMIEPSIIPVKDLGERSRTIISYTYYDALIPRDCKVMTGYYKDAQIEADEDYRLGCTIETQFAKQIARPKDLAGQSRQGDLSDGRRASNIVDVHRAGVPNQPLEGESASDGN